MNLLMSNSKFPFVVPLLIKNDSVEYQYTIAGTCFLVKRKERQFVVTAKHCIKDPGYDPARVFVAKSYGSREAVTIINMHSPNGMTYEDSYLFDKNQNDFILFEISNEPSKEIASLDITDDVALGLRYGYPVFSVGFPYDCNSIEYNPGKFKFFQKVTFGHYSKLEDDFTHLVQLDVEGRLMDGASGSPVMVGSPNGYKLVGILTRSDEKNKSGECAYIDASTILVGIDQILADE